MSTILTLGFQPNELEAHDDQFYGTLGADVYAYQTGNLQGVDYSKSFIDRAYRKLPPFPFLCSMDSHDFNDWNNDKHRDSVYLNTKLIADYMRQKGAKGVILNCEQENHLIPAGKFGVRSDPAFVWPGNKLLTDIEKKAGYKGTTNVEWCRGWVNSIRSVWPEAEIHLWLTAAVQANANDGFYPCINAICEAAGGCHIWLYMWEVGYGFGSDPNLPKRKTLPDKIQKGKTWLQVGKPNLWLQTAQSTFTQKVKNTIYPTMSFNAESVKYYQKQIAAKQAKDFSNILNKDWVDFYSKIPNNNLVLWEDVFAVDPAIYPYVQSVIGKLKGK